MRLIRRVGWRVWDAQGSRIRSVDQVTGQDDLHSYTFHYCSSFEDNARALCHVAIPGLLVYGDYKSISLFLSAAQ